METMKSAVLIDSNNIQIQERKIPNVVPGSLLLKVHSCAVCGSDLRIFQHGNERVKPPRILGHEIAGEVVEIGQGVTRFKVGDRVSVGADIPCGKCIHCTSGRPNCCDINLAIGYQFDGGFSQYILLDPLVVELGPVQKFDSTLPYNHAALSEPLACCINGYELGMMKPGGSVVIFGAGPIGLMLAHLSKIYEASDVTLIDPAQDRLALAARLGNKFGLSRTINPTKENPVDVIMQKTGGRGADMIFTACAVREAHEQAIAIVAKRGVVNLFGGLPKNAAPITVSSNHIHYREAYITGSHGSTPAQHKKALGYIQAGQIDASSLISGYFTLDNILDAFEHSKSRVGLKAVVNPNSDT